MIKVNNNVVDSKIDIVIMKIENRLGIPWLRQFSIGALFLLTIESS